MFVFRQVAKGKQRGRTVFSLTTAEAGRCTDGAATQVLEHLKVSGRGAFAVRTRASESASRRGTWTTDDRCDGTRTAVSKGTVTVRDLAKRRVVRLRAGQRYLSSAGS
jgi:hypothetical protein